MIIINKVNKYSAIHSIVRILVGAVFLLSAIGKMADFAGFALFIGKLLPITDTLSILISSVIIGVELFIGSFLVVKLYTKEASAIAVFVIVFLFIPFSIYAFMSSTIVDCGCFGAIEFLNTDNHVLNLLKNFILLSGIFFILKYNITERINYKIPSLFAILFASTIFISNYSFISDGLSLVDYVEIEEYLINPDDYILIDARDYPIYLTEHIPDAISIPYIGGATDLSELNELLSKQNSKKILTYCDVASCALAKLLALRISSQFKVPTYELNGGIEEWRKFAK